jgi:ankyrin repeat protein
VREGGQGQGQKRPSLGGQVEARESDAFDALSRAAEAGDAIATRALANEKSAKKWSLAGLDALTLAARGGHAECVRILLPLSLAKASAAAEKGGGTALMAAARGGHAECVRILLEAADPNHEGAGVDDGRTALSLAIEGGHAECAALLAPVTDMGIRARAGHDCVGLDALQLAAARGHAECVRALLPFCDPRETARAGFADASRSTALSRLGVSQSLMASDLDGRTALMIAASRGHADCVEILLPASDPSAVSPNGADALMLAADKGHARCVGLLLPASDPKQATPANKGGATALMMAARAGSVESMRLLAPVSDANHRGGGILDGQTALVRLAKTGCADPQTQTQAQARQLECARVLLAHGADWRIADRDGLGPLDWALWSRSWALADLLWSQEKKPVALAQAFEWGLSLGQAAADEPDRVRILEWATPRLIDGGEPRRSDLPSLLATLGKMAAAPWAHGVEALCARLAGLAAPKELAPALAAAVDAGCERSAEALLAIGACPWSRAEASGSNALERCAVADASLGELVKRLCGAIAGRPESPKKGKEWSQALDKLFERDEEDWSALILSALAKEAFRHNGMQTRGRILSRLAEHGEWTLADSLCEKVDPREAAQTMAEMMRARMPKMAARLEAGVIEAQIGDGVGRSQTVGANAGAEPCDSAASVGSGRQAKGARRV